MHISMFIYNIHAYRKNIKISFTWIYKHIQKDYNDNTVTNRISTQKGTNV